MKKSFLLITAGMIAIAANGQEAKKSLLFQESPAQYRDIVNMGSHTGSYNPAIPTPTALPTGRTTAAGDRWYVYPDYQATILGTGNFSNSAPYLWFDTTATVAYSGGTFARNNLVTSGFILDPFFSDWNDATLYPGEVAITPANTYTVDSFNIIGIYSRQLPYMSTTYTDTLIVAFVKGTGASTTPVLNGYFYNGNPPDVTQFPYPEFGVDTLRFLNLYHDSIQNHATNKDLTGATVGAAPIIMKIPLTAASVGDTDANGNWNKVFALPTAMTCNPGERPAMSVTFRSGDPTYTTVAPLTVGDTVFRGSTTTAPSGFYKHGMFRPIVLFNNTGGATQYPTYNKADWNIGVYKIEPTSWNGRYLPMQAYTSGTTASTLQYPWYSFHTNCPACVTTGTPSLSVANVAKVTNVNAYPNPAANEVNIPFTLSQSAAVTVSLTNVVGQVVATKNMGNVANGKAVFNTTTLPSGVYVYTLEANGVRTTGYVAIAH